MNGADYSFDLPPELVAQDPPEQRGRSLLLDLERGGGACGVCPFTNLPDLLAPGDLLVCNDSRVLLARLWTRRDDTGGRVELRNCCLEHQLAVVDRLEKIGVTVEATEGGCIVSRSGAIGPADVTTQPYPGFPTDLQAQLMAMLSLADGNSVITEKIFPDRFMHVAELNRMSAHLRKEGAIVIVAGVKKLIAAPVMASDLRASAALVLAGLAAEGKTIVNRVYHIDRGYERIEKKLNAVGAKITRVNE